ncbi:MAG: TonB-dependent receptor [Cyclobacteriaceae bacterium]
MKKFTFLSLLLGLFVSSAHAQSTTDSTGVSSEILLGEIEIVSDLFETKKKNFAGSVTGIQPKIIESANNLYLQPILNSVPGVYMQSGALNTNRITIRGMGSRSPFATNKIKAYLDEIPLSTGEGETTLEDIDFSTLGGIEVYRGPVSTMYGAGLGGAIHMITNKVATSNSGSSEFSMGSFGLSKYNLKIDMGNQDRGMSLYYQNVGSDGYRDNNEYDRMSISAIGRTKIWKKSNLTTYFNNTNLKAFIPSSLDLDDYQNQPTNAAFVWGDAQGFEDNKRSRLGLSLKTLHNETLESTFALFGNIGNSREVTPFGNEDITTTNFGLRAKIRKSVLPDEKLNLVFGTEVFRESFGIESFENNNSQNGVMTGDLNQDRNYSNIFLASEFRPSDKWVMTIGGNLNLSKYENTDRMSGGASAEQKFDPVFSPKLGITYLTSENLSVYATVAHGFSLPTFNETLNPNGDINEDIRSEQGLNYELGIKGSLADDKLYYEVAAYTMHINDLLVARRNSELDYSGFNAGKSTHNGIELLLNHKVIKTSQINLNQSLSYTKMDYSFDTFMDDDRGDFSGNQLTGVPSYTLDYRLNLETAIGIYGIINWQGSGAMPILDDNSVYSEAYNLVNLKLGFQKEIGKMDFNFYVGINNILDEKYASMVQINPRFNQRYYYPGLPINYFGGVKVGWRF